MSKHSSYKLIESMEHSFFPMDKIDEIFYHCNGEEIEIGFFIKNSMHLLIQSEPIRSPEPPLIDLLVASFLDFIVNCPQSIVSQQLINHTFKEMLEGL